MVAMGPISIRWYGLFLALGVLCSVLIIVKLFKQNNLKPQDAVDLCIWLIIGGLVGARLGEVLFYEPGFYFSHPLEIIFINHGGLSSHGMTLGLLVTFWLWARMSLRGNTKSHCEERGTSDAAILIVDNEIASSADANRPPRNDGGILSLAMTGWRKIVDLIIIPIPLLAAFIRLGNFFNSEIVGKPTNLPWGVKFPLYESFPVPRHPSQLYEALIALAICYLLSVIWKKYGPKLPPLFLTHLFLLLYFSSRFLIEFLKADYQTSLGLTMGQILSVPFILWSVGWFIQKLLRGFSRGART